MINIHPKYHIGRQFVSTKESNPDAIYTCIGTGQNENDGSNYFVGEIYEDMHDGYVISTHLLKDVCFLDSPDPKQTICG